MNRRAEHDISIKLKILNHAKEIGQTKCLPLLLP